MQDQLPQPFACGDRELVREQRRRTFRVVGGDVMGANLTV